MQPRTAFYALTLLLPACDNDDPPQDEPTIAELAACDESDLDPTPFMGPAFDDSGDLIAPLPQPHVVATTVGWHTPENTDALSAETQPPMMDLFTHDGFLGARFATSERCGSARTISLWRDDAARMKFVFGTVHSKAIKNGLKFTQGWETTNWSETASDQPPTWDDVRRRLNEIRQ
ncbi:hypothetical protein [Nannocystis punicea]|uniref:DUF3291 domain-containing protein n=1 Tax=Nannocystis punicea TaxID=2995304 RepID=A0ABY7HJN8_9BACT|nr:hypothetical protein [Nannocystis poenicansa]WAS99333.1 hypothetical protein O0S08_24660 [Nannocystis poenicansa]